MSSRHILRQKREPLRAVRLRLPSCSFFSAGATRWRSSQSGSLRFAHAATPFGALPAMYSHFPRNAVRVCHGRRIGIPADGGAQAGPAPAALPGDP